MLALLVALAVSAPATLSSGSGAERPASPIIDDSAVVAGDVRLAQSGIDPNAPDHVPTFVEQYLAFQISPVASKQVQDGLVLSHVIGYVCFPVCGGLWGPLIGVKDSQMTGDVFVSWLLSGVLWAAIGVVVSITVVGALFFLAAPYLTTTATLNAIDRDIKKRGLATGRDGLPTGFPPPPPPTATTPNPAPQNDDTPPPSYAY